MSDENISINKKDELLKLLDEMIETYSKLPREAMMQPITHWDHESLLLLIRAILKSIDIV